MKIFIDCHTHMFNVVDVPLHLAASDQFSMGTVKRLALALGGVVNVGKKGALSGMVDGEPDFIQFFERRSASPLVPCRCQQSI